MIESLNLTGELVELYIHSFCQGFRASTYSLLTVLVTLTNDKAGVLRTLDNDFDFYNGNKLRDFGLERYF